jgi:hypothetical protein
MRPEYSDLDRLQFSGFWRSTLSLTQTAFFAESPLEESVNQEITRQNGDRYEHCERHNKVMLQLGESGSPEQFVSNL